MDIKVSDIAWGAGKLIKLVRVIANLAQTEEFKRVEEVWDEEKTSDAREKAEAAADAKFG